MNTRCNVFIACLLAVLNVSAQHAEWVSSTNSNRWQKSKGVKFEMKLDSSKTDVVIEDEKAQLIEGIGGCFNEMGWDALQTIPEESRNKVIDNLFSTEKANFSYCRMPVGSSDYALNYYSLNDVSDDYKMINFNINRDKYILIPYIKAAQKAHPGLKIWASPWSPPAWMKTNNHYACNMDESGKDYNGLVREKITEMPTTAFKMQRGYLEAYALYFTKFVQAYESMGIQIEALNVQNEPCSNQKYPSCNWRPEDLTYFIGEFLGPKFEKEKIKTDIYFGTINRDNPDFTRVALNDKKAANYIKGVGFQWEGKWAIPTIHKEYPQLKIMQTETECGNGSNDWGAAEYTWWQINHYFKNGANTYDYWNMVLDQKGESNWGWVQNALISINKTSGEVVYNPEFYIMKHLSHYLVPGSYRLKTTEGDNHLAFINPDGKIVVIVVNNENNDKTMKIAIKDKILSFEMKAKSFNSLLVDLSN